MNNFLIIAAREYLTRVRKKSFIVMTILSPLLMVLFYSVIIYFSFNAEAVDDEKTITVIDESGFLKQKLSDTKSIKFMYTTNYNGAQDLLAQKKIYGILKINCNKNDTGFFLNTINKPSYNTISLIETKIERIVKDQYLEKFGISKDILSRVNNTKINLVNNNSKTSSTSSKDSGIATAIGFIGGFLIYLFIFLYGVQVMRGVIEEKTNRVVEVMVSVVKPFDLMMGKITGIALVGLTQFLAWILIVLFLGAFATAYVSDIFNLNSDITAGQQTANNLINNQSIMNLIGDFNYIKFILLFLFYFIGGYLFYGALFAAIGSAVDNETDTQQFMLPVTLPLIMGFMLSQSMVVNAPNSSASFWLSVLPFTSPVVMMVRAPFDVPDWQIITSVLCMLAGIFITIWLSSKIYRIGILSYGKKPTYKELLKWLLIKNW